MVQPAESNDQYKDVIIGSAEEARNKLLLAVLPTHFNGKHLGLHIDPDTIYVNPNTKVDNVNGMVIHTFVSVGRCEQFEECGKEFMILDEAVLENE